MSLYNPIPIRTVEDLKPFVSDKKEIRFIEQRSMPVTIGCYQFMDSKTFNSPQAMECRGVAFDREGNICSRPLHKFFNLGEKLWLTPDALLARDDVAAVYEKLDGSMIATAWVDGEVQWRSKKAFDSHVVHLTKQFLSFPENKNIEEFGYLVTQAGYTAIFELTHPEARIVVAADEPELRLLHIRHNVSGEYALLNKDHHLWDMVEEFRIPLAPRYEMTMQQVLESLATMQGREGYVVQFSNGDMVKIKCDWYQRLHRAVTFLRERDIAELTLAEQLDDVKAALIETGIDLAQVEEVETRVKNLLLSITDEVDAMYEAGKELDRKSFALANQGKALFGLAMARYLGKEPNVADWYRKARLKEDFTLRVLASAEQAQVFEEAA